MANYTYGEIRYYLKFLKTTEKEIVAEKLSKEFIQHIKNGEMLNQVSSSYDMHRFCGNAKINDEFLEVPKYLCVKNVEDFYMSVSFSIRYRTEPNAALFPFSFTKTKTTKNWNKIFATHTASSGSTSGGCKSQCTKEGCFDVCRPVKSGDDPILGADAAESKVVLGPNQRVWIKGSNPNGLCVNNNNQEPDYWVHMNFTGAFDGVPGLQYIDVYMEGDITSLMNEKGGDITVPRGKNYWFHGLFGESPYDNTPFVNLMLCTSFTAPTLSIFSTSDNTLYHSLFRNIESVNRVDTMQNDGALIFTDWLYGCSSAGTIHTRETTNLIYNDSEASKPSNWLMVHNLPEPKY